MSQQRTRKSIAAEQGPRGRSTFKAAGDQCPPMKQQSGDINGSVPLPNTNHKERNGSRSKIPKNLRNDLENALVGLCDVWFEDIKPHLVRNKIKLHVHGAGAASGAGDHRRLAADAPGCSHLDPGAARDPRQPKFANFASCWSTQPTASRAPCRRPPPPPPQPSSQVKVLCTQKQSPCRGHRAESPWMRRAPPQPDRSQQRVPRLCHTYGFPSNTTKTKPERFVTEPSVHKDSNHHLHGRQSASSFPRANSHHSATSTTELSKQIKCQVEQQKSRVSHDGANFKTFQEAVLLAPTTGPFLQNNAINTMRNPQKKRQSVPYQTHFPKHRQEIDQRQPCFRNTAASTADKLKRSDSTKFPTPYEQFAQDSKDKIYRRRPSLEGRTSRCPVPSTLHRHPSKIQLQLTKHNINFHEEPAHQKSSLTATNICRPTLSRSQSKWQLHRDQKLFQDDLVDIIAERNKKNIEVLFKSPQRVESTSVMNLLDTGHAQALRTKPYAKKIPPWR